jgi:hypothetical protein
MYKLQLDRILPGCRMPTAYQLKKFRLYTQTERTKDILIELMGVYLLLYYYVSFSALLPSPS